MSYDVDLDFDPPACPHCGRAFHCDLNLPSPTYNLTPIFDLALTGEPMVDPGVTEGQVVLLGAKTTRPRGLRLLSGMRGEAAARPIARALDRLRDPARQDEFRALQPENSGGTLATAIAVLGELLAVSFRFPQATWRIR